MVLFLYVLYSGWSVLLCEWDLFHVLLAVLPSVIKHMSCCNSLWYPGQQGRTGWYHKEGEDAGLCEVYQERCGIFQVWSSGTSFLYLLSMQANVQLSLLLVYNHSDSSKFILCIFKILFFSPCFAGKINRPMHSWFPKSQVSMEFVKLRRNHCC